MTFGETAPRPLHQAWAGTGDDMRGERIADDRGVTSRKNRPSYEAFVAKGEMPSGRLSPV
jgi:hypothetical protein